MNFNPRQIAIRKRALTDVARQRIELCMRNKKQMHEQDQANAKKVNCQEKWKGDDDEFYNSLRATSDSSSDSDLSDEELFDSASDDDGGSIYSMNIRD